MHMTTASRCLLAAILLSVGFPACSRGQPAPSPPRPATAEKPSPIPAPQVATLRRHVGRQVTVVGHVARASESSSGHQFLNFADSELTAFCSGRDVKAFTAGPPSRIYADRDIRVTGKLELYRGKLQIRFDDPRQVTVVEASAESRPKPETAKVQLRKIGRDRWISPAGLVYAGRDPNGLTRVQHVARHFQDLPARDGPHGVFDGDEEVALAVIDEAWRRAQRGQLQPRREGDRSSLTVPMGRRVGYLGGRLGADRGHPPLSRVFIVYETGTKNLITAFPK